MLENEMVEDRSDLVLISSFIQIYSKPPVFVCFLHLGAAGLEAIFYNFVIIWVSLRMSEIF